MISGLLVTRSQSAKRSLDKEGLPTDLIVSMRTAGARFDTVSPGWIGRMDTRLWL
jgi:hypothetical protein